MELSEVKTVVGAADQGDTKTLQEFIAQGRVGVVDEDRNTPLIHAAANGREEVLRMLLDKDCLSSNKLDEERKGVKYIDFQNRYGWTSLMQAACYGHSGSVVLLVQQGAQIDLKNAWKASCLVLASQGGHFGVVHTLINHGAQVDPDDVKEDLLSCTLTPLMAAAQCGHVDVVRELLRGGAKLEIQVLSTRWTALMFAALNNKVATVELLLGSGADKEARDIEGKRAVDLALCVGHHGVAALLQSAGQTIRNISNSEFFEAVNKGHVEKVKELLSMKPSLALMEDKDGATPLMFASNKGYREVCQVLLEAKADVNTKDRKYGWTGLMHATHHRKYEVVELLGRSGADVNVRDLSGSTAYDIASIRGDIKMIKLIANITIERLEAKATLTSEPMLETSQDVGVPDTSHTSNQSQEQAAPVQEPTQPIDLSELKSRLQNAYRTPTPTIEVSRNEEPQTPPAHRFPSARIGRGSGPSSNHSPFSLAASDSKMSPASNRIVSPSRSAGSNHLLSKQHHPSPPPHINSPFSANPHHTPPPRINSPFSASPHRPTSLSPVKAVSKGFTFKPSGPSAVGPPGQGKRNLDSPRQHKYHPASPSRVPGDVWSHKPTPSSSQEPGLASERPSAESWKKKDPRQYANTASQSVAKAVARPSVNLDLKSVLEEAELEKHMPIFKKEEIDLELFKSLRAKDLVEMGIEDKQEREQLLALILRLPSPSPRRSHNSHPTVEGNQRRSQSHSTPFVSSPLTPAGAEVFVFH